MSNPNNPYLVLATGPMRTHRPVPAWMNRPTWMHDPNDPVPAWPTRHARMHDPDVPGPAWIHDPDDGAPACPRESTRYHPFAHNPDTPVVDKETPVSLMTALQRLCPGVTKDMVITACWNVFECESGFTRKAFDTFHGGETRRLSHQNQMALAYYSWSVDEIIRVSLFMDSDYYALAVAWDAGTDEFFGRFLRHSVLEYKQTLKDIDYDNLQLEFSRSQIPKGKYDKNPYVSLTPPTPKCTNRRRRR